MEQQDWASRVSRTVATEVRRHRQAQGISAQQLADRCGELGMPALQRSVIANLENGRRGSITLAETLVLAEALSVAPAALAFPVGYAETVEVLPGRQTPPLAAVDWWNGAGRDDDSALALLRAHQNLEQRIRGHYRRIWETAVGEQQWHGEPDGPEAQAARQVAAELTAQLHELREDIASRGLLLPPLAGLDAPSGDRPTAQ